MWILEISSCLVLLTGILNAEICPSSDKESVLQPGYEYTYRFESEALAEAVGTTNDKSKISIKCDAVISHSTDCFYGLNLNDCMINADGGPPGSEVAWIANQPLSDLSKYSVSFSLVNGEITEVYSDENDPVYFVNIKRGALSAFVFKLSYTTRTVQEMHTDIHGTCPFTSTPLDISEGSVKTKKDMLHCSFPSRKDWQFSPYSMFWNMSFIQYVINSTTDCDYGINVNENRIEKVSCKERHAIMLESSSNTAVAVQSNIHYAMTYVDSSLQTEKKDFSSATRKTDIRYEYERTPDPQSNPENFLPIAKKMLSDLVENSIDEIRLFTIPQFTDFIAWIRSGNNLVPLLEAAKSCSYLTEAQDCTPLIKELGMSYIRDALIQCNSLPCIEATSYLVKNGDFSSEYLNYYSWSNMHFSKPAILKHIMDICRNTDSSLCWISLGSLVRRIYFAHEDIEKDKEQLKEVADHFHRNIERSCVPEDTDPKKHSNLLRDLKAIRSMGRVYLLLIPEGYIQLTKCVLKADVPDRVRTFALETLQTIQPCQNGSSCDYIYRKLLTILLDKAASTTLRALSYQNIIEMPQKYGFEVDLLTILKTDENLQLKSYIASSLKFLLKDSYFTNKEEKFVKSLDKLLKDGELSLDEIIHEPGAKSTSEIRRFAKNLSFMPEELKSFGFRTFNSRIYESSDVLPRYINNDFIAEVFSNFVKFFKSGGYSEGTENVAIVLQKILKDFNSEFPSLEKLLEGVQEAIKEFKPSDSKLLPEYNFQEKIIRNIRKLERVYRKSKPAAKSSFTLFLDLFGSTLGYFSSEDIAALVPKLFEMHTLMEDLERGLTYNATKVIRIIEAYHQIPTMMGLPLNWTTNATLGFSLRSGLKVKLNPEKLKLHSDGYFQPSAALTFLNRMVIDFPTITQIGVQANSSGYTSTQWKAKLEYSDDKKIFSIEKPSKSQKILELFRTNQLIKHDTYQNIEDWDIERTSSSSCSSDQMSALFGLQVCLSKSYPVVTKHLKPWALMSGSCKWQLVINPFDKNLESYNLEKIESPETKPNNLVLRFSTSGGENKREMFLETDNDATKGETKVFVKVPSLPEFGITYLQNRPTESSRERRSSNIVILKLMKNHHYQLIYNEDIKSDKRETNNTSVDGSSKSEQVISIVHEQILSLDTPYNSYRFSKEDLKSEDDVNTKVLLSYENLSPSGKWLHTILPKSFWETDTKAWVRFQIHWKGQKVYTHATSRQTVCFIKDPQSTVELNANSFEMSGREQININLTKNEISSGKLLGFANFTYDLWNSQGDDLMEREIRNINLTISHKSWAIQVQKVREKEKFLCEVALSRAVMYAKEDKISDYVGWWSKEASQVFRFEEKQIKLIIDTEMRMISNEELTNKYSTSKIQDIEGLTNELITANVGFYYPFGSGTETVTVDGYFIISRGPTTFRFQKNFVMKNSYNDLQLTSHSVYKTDKDLTSLYLKSNFMHIPSEAKVLNIIEYWRSHESGKCMEISLTNNILSEFWDLFSNTSYRCNSDRNDMYTLLHYTKSNSSYWNMLDLEINQIIEDTSPEYRYETCNFTHPLVLINVTANWDRKNGNLNKRGLFTCTKKDCQSTELLIQHLQNGKFTAKLIMPDDGNRKLSFERTISSDAKTQDFRINYSSDEDDQSNELQLKGEILNENYHIWNVKVNLDTYAKVKSLFANGYKGIIKRITTIAKDPQHPVNKMLEPSLKVTIYHYFQEFQKQRNDFIYVSWKDLKETVGRLRPFYEAPITLLLNIAYAGKAVSLQMYNAVKDRSVIIWTINYFNLPTYFYESVTNVRDSVEKILEILRPDDGIMRWEFVTGRIIKMESFQQWPSIDLQEINLNPFADEDSEIRPNHVPSGGDKISMIFGPLHVYTFDGHLYDAAEYSADCTFLLAHDLRKSTFTVLADKTTIHILFPEMSVSVNSENEVFVNRSETASKLPIEAANGKVIVRRSNVVEIWSPSLSVVCNAKDFLCVLELNTWHSGGTFGLLGNADGSSGNELMLPDGRVVSDILDFISKYEVSGKPECRNLRLRSKPPHSNEAAETCSRQFGKLCRLNKSNMESFLDACKSDFENYNDACYASSGYSALCFYKQLRSATDCNGMKQEDKRIGQNLEVVLIVHEHRSFGAVEKKTPPYKGIEKLLTVLDDKFRSNGYSSILYSLVGFGGKGARHQPTVHAKERNVWMPLRTLLKDELKTLKFDGSDDIDVLHVLKYAAEVMGYDTFHSKIFIVLTTKDKQSKNKKAINAIQQHLEKNGITLYTFASYPTIEKGKKVFGVRADGLIFPSPKKDGSTFLDYPKGDLAKITSATRGSVFLTKFIVSNNPASFFGEFANEVWSKVHNEAQNCRECSSVRNGWWWQVNQCNIVHC